jgi:hypothetical protein
LNTKRKDSRAWLLGVLVLVVLVPAVFLIVKRMEGTPPEMRLEMRAPTIGAGQTLTLKVEDRQSGIRQVWVALLKDGTESVLLDRFFPAGNLLSGGMVHQETLEIPVDVAAYGLKDGKAMLRLMARDFSWRKWGAGNQQYQEHEVVIDTKAPNIDVLSNAHNLNQGGAGLVIYKLSEDCPTSGVSVGDRFYPGAAGNFSDPKIYMCFIALDYTQDARTPILVTATDFAGNEGHLGLPHHFNDRRFREDTISISDQFLNWKMPEFKSMVGASADEAPIDIFLKVNRDLRAANYEKLVQITAHSESTLFWKGAFMRLPHSANRARFADHRTYMYNGKKIDEQRHMGIDLASLQQSPVPAGNTGKVAFADTLGIYGQTVVLDHGFGLFSMYSHLSTMAVSTGEVVQQGDIIGKTGVSGLAGGDHLHFGMLVHQTFVNPVEWWDAQWIENNVRSKLAAVK